MNNGNYEVQKNSQEEPGRASACSLRIDIDEFALNATVITLPANIFNLKDLEDHLNQSSRS